MTRRDGGIDVLKGVAIISVVAYHLGMAWTPLAVCCPIFFLVNGQLTLSRPFAWKRHVRRLAGIALLTILWSLIAQTVWMVSGRWAGPIRPIGNTIRLVQPVNNWLWFMLALLAVHLAAPVLKHLLDHAFPMFVMLTILVTGCAWAAGLAPIFPALARMATVPPFNTEIGWALAMFCIGGCLARVKPFTPAPWMRIPLAGIAVIIAWLPSAMFSARGLNPVWDADGLPGTTLAVILLWLAVRGTHPTPLSTFMGSTTLCAYLTHWLWVMTLPAGSWWATPLIWLMASNLDQIPLIRRLTSI